MHTPERTCNEFQSQLPLHVGGDLEAPLVEGLEQHLAACPACAGTIARLRASRALLLGLRAVDTLAQDPDEQVDLWPRLRPELARMGAFGPEATPQAPQVPQVIGSRKPQRLLPWGMLAAAGLVGLLVWLGTRDSNEGPVGPESPVVVEDTTPVGQRLQRAAPDAEHLADTAVEFTIDGPLDLPGGRRAAHRLATENGLR